MIKKNLFLFFALILTIGLIFACGGKKVKSYDELTENAPNWVIKGSGAFPSDKGAVLYGVGIMGKDPNVALQRETADTRARNDLAKVLHTYVGSMLKYFMESHKDYMNPQASGSVEFVSVITKSVTDATLEGSEIIDRWTDKDSNLYSLASLSFDNVAKVIKNKFESEARKEQGVLLKAKADDAMKELNDELNRKSINP